MPTKMMLIEAEFVELLKRYLATKPLAESLQLWMHLGQLQPHEPQTQPAAAAE